VAWEKQRRPQDNYKQCLARLRATPNFALTFTSDAGDDLCTYINEVSPNRLVTLGAKATGIQANCDNRVEHDIDAALMLGHFPTDLTSVVPFSLEDCNVHEVIEKVQNLTPGGTDAKAYWKVFIVYICGSGYYSSESFVSTLQQRFPDAAIVGGICESGYVSIECTKELLEKKSAEDLRHLWKMFGGKSFSGIDPDQGKDQLLELTFNILSKRKYVVERFEDGIFGMVFGGDVPVRSIVSRGVKSVTGDDTLSLAHSRFTIQSASFSRPEDDDYMFRGDPELLKPTHIIRQIKNHESGLTTSPLAMLSNVIGSRQPEFIGLRRAGQDGYELHPLSPFSLQTNSIILMTDGSIEQEETLVGAEIDLFALEPQACLQHLEDTLSKLKLQTEDDVILGGIMFSCNGRGPERRSMLREEMADARKFHKHFPHVALCGFYAGGEVGPMAMVGKQEVFQKGKAAVQGFTVVFALFIVPPVKPGSFHLDDSPANVDAFVRDFLRGDNFK
jgi:small ligand-binding sensory domain FIST